MNGSTFTLPVITLQSRTKGQKRGGKWKKRYCVADDDELWNGMGVIDIYNPQLETFICAAEAGSFNKAAEELFISPPAVIKQINLLEAQLNLTLFIRTHRGLKLTENSAG